ncbi:5219_t:CDS:2, partial [Diversispora eburnea]
GGLFEHPVIETVGTPQIEQEPFAIFFSCKFQYFAQPVVHVQTLPQTEPSLLICGQVTH